MMIIASNFDTTKKTPSKEFKAVVNNTVATRLDYNLPVAEHSKEETFAVYQQALEAAKDQTMHYNSKGFVGSFMTASLQNVPMVAFGIPGFTKDEYYEFQNEWLKGNLDFNIVGFQRLYNANHEVATAYLKQLWQIICDGFSLDKVEEIVVWYDKKTGRFIVIDGGHTIILYMILGMPLIYKLKILLTDNFAQALDFYVNQHKFKTNLSSFQTQVAQLAQKDPTTIDIFTAVTKRNINLVGFEVDKDNATMRCFDALKSVYEDYYLKGVEFVLDVPLAAWGLKDKSITSKHIINSLHEIYEACAKDKKAMKALYTELRKHKSAHAFMVAAKDAIVNKYETIDGRTGEGPITTYLKFIVGMEKLIPINK